MDSKTDTRSRDIMSRRSPL